MRERPTTHTQKMSRQEALERLAQKEVTPAYRGPRGNPDLNREALAVSVGASERLLTH
jgi:hypothetical protein